MVCGHRQAFALLVISNLKCCFFGGPSLMSVITRVYWHRRHGLLSILPFQINHWSAELASASDIILLHTSLPLSFALYLKIWRFLRSVLNQFIHSLFWSSCWPFTFLIRYSVSLNFFNLLLIFVLCDQIIIWPHLILYQYQPTAHIDILVLIKLVLIKLGVN